jgi:5-methylcytosine-specific restriction protein A
VHRAVAWGTRTGVPPRITGRARQRLRAALFARQPWCVLCLTRGVRTRPTIRDHIHPLAEGGRDVDSNTQAICETCSRVKTDAESTRGMRRRAWMR